MRKALVVSILAAMAWPAVGAAQTPDAKQPVIVVIGNGSASQPPDYGSFGYTVRGEGKSEVAALQALQEIRAKVEGALTKLADTKRVDIESSDLGVSPARGPDCKPDDSGDTPTALSTGPCAVIGFVATLKSKVEVEPAPKVGDAISLASQLGAQDASFTEWDVQDFSALHDAAVRDAVTKAKREAALIAEASGLKLGPIVRMEDAAARGLDGIQDEANFSPLWSRSVVLDVRPQVPVDLKPAPVEASASFALTFAIAP